MRLLRRAWPALLFVALLTSRGGGPPTASQRQATLPVTATPGTGVAPVAATILGTLTFVDPLRRIISVTTQPGAVLVLSVVPAATVTVDEVDATVADLGDRIGAEVTAMYNAANNIATRVEVSR